jgi:hypothetical protein
MMQKGDLTRTSFRLAERFEITLQCKSNSHDHAQHPTTISSLVQRFGSRQLSIPAIKEAFEFLQSNVVAVTEACKIDLRCWQPYKQEWNISFDKCPIVIGLHIYVRRKRIVTISKISVASCCVVEARHSIDRGQCSRISLP